MFFHNNKRNFDNNIQRKYVCRSLWSFIRICSNQEKWFRFFTVFVLWPLLYTNLSASHSLFFMFRFFFFFSNLHEQYTWRVSFEWLIVPQDYLKMLSFVGSPKQHRYNLDTLIWKVIKLKLLRCIFYSHNFGIYCFSEPVALKNELTKKVDQICNKNWIWKFYKFNFSNSIQSNSK